MVVDVAAPAPPQPETTPALDSTVFVDACEAFGWCRSDEQRRAWATLVEGPRPADKPTKRLFGGARCASAAFVELFRLRSLVKAGRRTCGDLDLEATVAGSRRVSRQSAAPQLRRFPATGSARRGPRGRAGSDRGRSVRDGESGRWPCCAGVPWPMMACRRKFRSTMTTPGPRRRTRVPGGGLAWCAPAGEAQRAD